MPMFCGCMSSKNASSAEKKVKPKAEKPGKKKGDTIQNGGERTEDPTPKEAAENPGEPPGEVSASQVDVTERVKERFPQATAASSDNSSSENRLSFIPRPLTIVNEGSLISEIVSALDNPSADRGKQTEEENQKVLSEPSQNTQLPPTVITQSASDTTTTTTATATTTTTTTTVSETKETNEVQDPEQELPPILPPRPKPLSQNAATSSSDAASETGKARDEPPPSLPPRTVPPSEKPTVVEAEKPGKGEEESPPTLPPRCVPPSPPPPRRPSVTMNPAPPKPRRLSTDSGMEEGVLVRKAKPASFRAPPPLPDDWAIIELPKTDAELMRLTNRPEQLAAIAAQYVVKHISLHTDVRVTSELSEQINTAFLQVSRQHRGILQRFLTDLIEDQANSGGTDGQPAEPSHGAVIGLVREILRQFVNTERVVGVSLAVLRAVSGVPRVTQSLVECEVTGAVLSTMSAHKPSATVQCSCLTVLARIAAFPPSLSHKAPLDQLAADLICQSLETFPKSSAVVQAGCHVLSTLFNTLYQVVSTAVNNEARRSEEQEGFLTGLLVLMDYIFSKNLPAVRSALKCQVQDPAIMSDGRQFVAAYCLLDQLRQRMKQRLSGSSPTDTPPPLPKRHGEQPSAATFFEQLLGSVPKAPVTGAYVSQFPFGHSLEYENWDLLRGVLKKKSSLKGHPYSKADLNFMQQLMKTQVVALVCALAVDGLVQEALALLDQPVAHIVLTTEVPPGVRDFVAYHCTPTHTLIDLDAGLFVSLIDAVRYPSLSYQMAQRNVLKVASSLDGEQQVPVVSVTVEFLASTITNRPLAPAMTVPGFVEEVCSELERAKVVSKNRGALESLLSEIRQCARKTDHSN